MIRLVTVVFLWHISAASADSLPALPDPLSLQQAMAMANDNQHYQIIEAEAAMAETQSQLEHAESGMGFKAQLEIEAAYIEASPIAFDQSSNDSSATLRLIKPLYDFGGSDEKILAASTEKAALHNHMPYIIAHRKLEIAKKFFDVILADLKYTWDNEALAIAYIRFDGNKDRHGLTQISDVELLESENEYLDTLHARNLSEIDQRHSRALLAESINRPEQLPSNLQIPEFDFSQLKLPDYKVLLENIMQNNPDIKLAEERLDAAGHRLYAEKEQFKPHLNAEVELSEYARDAGSHDEWRAQLNLVIPLYENSGMKRDIAKARADWLKQRAMLLNIKMQTRKNALHLWQSINVLNKRREQLQVTKEYRELNLDKSRALYEMEVKTNLGSSFVAISEIQYKQAKNDFDLALAQMQLSLLSGELDVLNTLMQTGK